MQRFIVSLITSILAFTAGLVTASSWSMIETTEPVTVNVSQPCPPAQPPSPAPVQSYSVTPPRELYFGQNGLRLLPERIQLKSDIHGYDIDVSYPQILAIPYTEQAGIITNVNQQIQNAATKLHQWPRDPEKRLSDVDVKRGIRNTVNFTYHVGLATDSVLSLDFVGYSYNGGLQRQTEDSFSVNYDLTSGKQLKLSDLFKPRSNYLEFLSSYCINEISKRTRHEVKTEALSPATENFDNWKITTSGVTFYFPTCQVTDCMEGDVTVEIFFEELQPMLKPDIPREFKITYP